MKIYFTKALLIAAAIGTPLVSGAYRNEIEVRSTLLLCMLRDICCRLDLVEWRPSSLSRVEKKKKKIYHYLP